MKYNSKVSIQDVISPEVVAFDAISSAIHIVTLFKKTSNCRRKQAKCTPLVY